MGLNQILRRIRRQPAEPALASELTAEQRALFAEWNKNLEGWTEADFEELERRSIEGREEEIKRDLAEADAYFARHREERRRQRK